MPDLGEIARAIGEEYLRTHRTTPFQRKALRAIERCRTPAMQSLSGTCANCGVDIPLFRSCRNRHCPQCQAQARAAWLEAREQELLPVPYFHVVFTVPEMLNPLALYCPEVFYAALLQAAGNALLDVGRLKLKAQLGCLTILHTWGQNLMLHPHVHCVVPGGGFSLDRTRWVSVRNPSYLLPIKALRRRFRTLLCEALRAAARNGRLDRLPKNVPPNITIEGAAAQEWIAYVKPPFGGPEQVLEYLSRYTHRVAISNRRILSFSENKVTFQWRDYSDSNRSKYLTIDASQFLRRFLLHILPNRFVRIRYVGFLANRHRSKNIERARAMIARPVLLRFHDRPKPVLLCPACYAKSSARAEKNHKVRPPPLAHHAA
jgi:putative transposase/transposase-like zinc-binding protein